MSEPIRMNGTLPTGKIKFSFVMWLDVIVLCVNNKINIAPPNLTVEQAQRVASALAELT